MNKFILLAALLTFAGFAAKAATDKPTTGNPPPPDPTPGNGSAPDYVLITDFDSTWDYKRENAIWYTRKKGASTWIDMQPPALTQANYDLAVSRLNAHLAKKGLSSLGCIDKTYCNCGNTSRNLGFIPELIAATTVSHIFREGVLTHDNRPQKVESNLVMV